MTGISAGRLNAIEALLKRDCLREAASNYGNVLVHQTSAPGVDTACFEAVESGNVFTNIEVFSSFNDHMRFIQVPVTPECVMGYTEIDALINTIRSAAAHALFVFNDHLGKGRVALAMVFASMILYHSSTYRTSGAASIDVGVSDQSMPMLKTHHHT